MKREPLTDKEADAISEALDRACEPRTVAECLDCRDALNPTEPRPFSDLEAAAFHKARFGHHDVRTVNPTPNPREGR